MTYMTRQQQAILTCIQSCDGGIGAAELTETLHRQGETVGLTTVYRTWSGWKRQAKFTKS